MIRFKNIAGNSFLAVGTISRKHALNGEKSLSGVLYDGADVLDNIDKGWSLSFDNETYVVTYFERNDNDNTLSFDAIHEFFWNMSKRVLYSQNSGSHTIQWYLDQVFADTGFSYNLNFSPNAIEKENWGMKTKLSLFNGIITSINAEFDISGTLVSIEEKIGSDLSTIVRYGFNLSDMSIENDAAGFVTYGEGFGAYEDQQNQSGPRLHTTYTSPLASVYGILQAEPVDDQRYTIESNLKDAIKAKIDASFSVSIKLSLYDLTAAGYPYRMARVGDWITAIDEKLNFKQRIRIISVDDDFSANGNRISYTVTAGNIGVVQKYQEANASLSSQVSGASANANKAIDTADNALSVANTGLAKANEAYDKADTLATSGVFYESGVDVGGVGIGKNGVYIVKGSNSRAVINDNGFLFVSEDIDALPLKKATFTNGAENYVISFSANGKLMINGIEYVAPTNNSDESVGGNKTLTGLTFLSGGLQLKSPNGTNYIVSVGDDGNLIATQKGI